MSRVCQHFAIKIAKQKATRLVQKESKLLRIETKKKKKGEQKKPLKPQKARASWCNNQQYLSPWKNIRPGNGLRWWKTMMRKKNPLLLWDDHSRH